MEIMELLYKISELCKDNDITFEIRYRYRIGAYIIIKWLDLFSYDKPMVYKQAFSLLEIENKYKTLENVIDEFLTRRDKALDRFKKGVIQNETDN